MKHRPCVTVAAAPAASVLLAQTPAPFADDVVGADLKFFSPRQCATLCRLSHILMPRTDGNPSNLEARIPKFLDALLKDSPESHRRLYLSGLDTLDFQSQATFYKPFARTTTKESDSLLAPLLQPWIYRPSSTLVDFLRVAKQDIRRASLGSREFALATPAVRRPLELVRH